MKALSFHEQDGKMASYDWKWMNNRTRPKFKSWLDRMDRIGYLDQGLSNSTTIEKIKYATTRIQTELLQNPAKHVCV
ncbi:hypothetical protein WA026_017250 [Henosepilachna vigintioctopunctata]|uniref:Uncharacterized protein n=1 Tax=Henosepilachna vigintioctopunctata TaxID=420089 RepID=A0AAW1UQG1_9CUCU